MTRPARAAPAPLRLPAVRPTVPFAFVHRRPLSEQPHALAAVGVAVLLAHAALLEWHWQSAAAQRLAAAPLSQVMLVQTLALSASPRAMGAPDPTPSPAPVQPSGREPTPDPASASAGVPSGNTEGRSSAEPGEAVPLPDLPSAPRPMSELTAPAAIRLSYLAHRGAASGSAVLDWAPSEDGKYTLQWQVTLPDRSEVDWVSQGEIGAEGLSPLRMVERRKGRDRAAVNFQRDKGIVSFSGTARSFSLAAGTQDRASWMLQLPLLALAADVTLRDGTPLFMPVATVRGDMVLWRFDALEQTLLTRADGSTLATWRFLREPERPYDTRIEVWLAIDHDMLPVQLRMGLQPGGEALELSLIGGLPAPRNKAGAPADAAGPAGAGSAAP